MAAERFGHGLRELHGIALEKAEDVFVNGGNIRQAAMHAVDVTDVADVLQHCRCERHAAVAFAVRIVTDPIEYLAGFLSKPEEARLVGQAEERLIAHAGNDHHLVALPLVELRVRLVQTLIIVRGRIQDTLQLWARIGIQVELPCTGPIKIEIGARMYIGIARVGRSPRLSQRAFELVASEKTDPLGRLIRLAAATGDRTLAN